VILIGAAKDEFHRVAEFGAAEQAVVVGIKIGGVTINKSCKSGSLTDVASGVNLGRGDAVVLFPSYLAAAIFMSLAISANVTTPS
jgi:hypothetical protein